MKRTVIVAILTFVMVFAFAGVALAAWGGASPTSFYNTEGSTTGYDRERPVYVQWADVVDTYNDGDGTQKGTAVMNSGEFNTPHKGYATTTTLCAVCHSVHFAPVYDGLSRMNYTTARDAYLDGVPWAEKLLRTSAGNSCNYCHIETSIGGIQIYGGDVSIYGTSQNFTSSFAHDYHGNTATSGCLVCHSVHGSNTYDGPLGGKILVRLAGANRDRAPQPEVIAATPNPLDPATGEANTIAPLFDTLADAYAGTDIAGTNDRWVQQVAFCTSCHWTYTDNSSTAHTVRGGTQYHKNHPMVSADGSNVAFAGSGTCRDCHDAGGVNQYKGAIGAPIDNLDSDGNPATGFSSNNFPHYTAGNYRFLNQGDFTGENKVDQSCIKCHQNSAGDAGVGISF